MAWKERHDAVLDGAMQIAGRVLSADEISDLELYLPKFHRLTASQFLACLGQAAEHFQGQRIWNLARAGHDWLRDLDQAEGDRRQDAIAARPWVPPDERPPLRGGSATIAEVTAAWAAQRGLAGPGQVAD